MHRDGERSQIGATGPTIGSKSPKISGISQPRQLHVSQRNRRWSEWARRTRSASVTGV